jgi:hypothetical protein
MTFSSAKIYFNKEEIMAASLIMTVDINKDEIKAVISGDGKIDTDEVVFLSYLLGFSDLIIEIGSPKNTNDTFFNLLDESHRARFRSFVEKHVNDIADSFEGKFFVEDEAKE